MILITFLLLSTIIIICDGLDVLGSSGPLTVQPGDSVLLPCSIETPVAVDELEVEWRKTDHETLVHLFQDGQVQSESQDKDYIRRTHFFPQEIRHGNFSLLLSNVTSKDAGIYKCIVHTNKESNETLIEIKLSGERFNVSVGHAVFVYVGEETTLNCSVDTHIPFEKIEEVSWKRKDDDISVLLYQDGSVVPEATHERYRDRVEFFSAEEIQKGNFSLKLKDVRTEDKGLYVCEAFSGEFSANGTVEILQLGISNMHIGVLILCLVALGVTLSLSWPTCMSIKRSNYSNCNLKLHYTLVFFPNIVLAVAFIFWGVIEGTVPELITCSTLNLLRIVELFWFAPYLRSFPKKVQQFLKDFAVSSGILVITIAAYSVAFGPMWHRAQDITDTTQEIVGKLFVISLTVLFVMPLICIFCTGFCIKTIKAFATEILIDISHTVRASLFLFLNDKSDLVASLFISTVLSSLLLFYTPLSLWAKKKYSIYGDQSWSWVAFLVILLTLNASLSAYIHLEIGGIMKVLAVVNVFIYILTAIVRFENLLYDTVFLIYDFFSNHTRRQRLHESNSNQIRSQPLQGFDFRVTESKHLSVLHTIVYMFGAVGLIIVNSVALATELILKARNGERTVEDLQLILLPFESLFAMGCLALLMTLHCRKNKTLFKTQLMNCQSCFSQQGPRDSMAQNDELERLPPEEGVTTSIPLSQDNV